MPVHLPSTHPLENHVAAAVWFTSMRTRNQTAGWRRAVLTLTGSLPTWAVPKPRGRKSTLDHRAARRDILAGMTNGAIADKHGCSWSTVERIRKAMLK